MEFRALARGVKVVNPAERFGKMLSSRIPRKLAERIPLRYPSGGGWAPGIGCSAR